MSGKQEKRLRKAARGLVVTLEQAGNSTIPSRQLLGRQYRSDESDLSPQDHLAAGKTEAEVEELFKDVLPYAVSAVNNPQSYRGIVRSLKKGMKAGKIHLPMKV